MYLKKLKRKCMVRGCKETETFAIAQTREVGNSIIVCKDCLKKAIEAIENYNPNEGIKEVNSPPPLFFATIEEEKEEAADENNIHICQHCGKECASKAGLLKHENSCKLKEV